MSKEELNRRLEEQQKQLVTYEKKLKDVVRAYKSLETEKKALEVALEALGAQNATEENPSSSSESESLSHVEALKQAISTLTIENKKKELAFQADRKALLAKNEQLKAQLDKVQDDVSTKKLKEKLQEVETEKEKTMSDHGAIVSEMHSKISELYRKLQERDHQVQSMELKLKDMAKLESEMLHWKKKAETTPTVQLLREELANAKASYEKELSTIIGRYSLNANELGEKESRIAHLEERIRELTEKSATREQENVELNNVITELRSKLKIGASSTLSLGKQKEAKELEAKDTFETLIYNFKSTFYKLKTKDPSLDIYTVLGIEKPIATPTASEVDIVPVSPTLKNTKKTIEETSDEGDSRDSAQQDLNYFKSLIGHLQKKLRVLEKNHDGMKSAHEQTTNSLRQRIAELETLHEKTYAHLTEETKRKVTELEEEMQKQRIRMLDIISEKDREIEITKNSLAALYTQHYVSDPIDPPQKTDRNSPQPLANLRLSSESIRSALTYCTEDNEIPGRRSRSPVKRSISNHFGETRNVFYEQELTRREQEIVELRNIIRLSEMKIRDIEQAVLTKDIQYLQIIEALKEEIRVLEGRLVLQNSETNIEYLRNIFIQFLHSQNPTGRKHILRAIGAVLKLTQVEMKKVEAWNF